MFQVNIKEIRQKRKLSQLELARMTRIAPSDLSLIENGKRYAFPGWRKRLSEALNVNEKELFPEVDENVK